MGASGTAGADLRFGRDRVAVVHLRGAGTGAPHRDADARRGGHSDRWRLRPSDLRKLGGRGAVLRRHELHRRVDVHRRPVRLRRRSGRLRARLRRLVQRRLEPHRRSGAGLLPRHRLALLRAARAGGPRRDDHDDQGPILGADGRLSHRQARPLDHRRRRVAAERADRRRTAAPAPPTSPWRTSRSTRSGTALGGQGAVLSFRAMPAVPSRRSSRSGRRWGTGACVLGGLLSALFALAGNPALAEDAPATSPESDAPPPALNLPPPASSLSPPAVEPIAAARASAAGRPRPPPSRATSTSAATTAARRSTARCGCS